MSGPGSGSAPKRPKNPLLYGADLGFPFDNLQGSAILMPIAHEETSEPLPDASKPPASVLPPEPTPTPLSTIPSAAAPLFSLFKQALGGTTEPQPLPVPQPAPEPATSEVPLYAPTAAPILVPLFDPKTLEVNGNEPSADVVNGNAPPPQQPVSFFDPSKFQSGIASLRGAASPAQFTQQPPPDLPAPTPKSEATLSGQPQSQTAPVFTTAPSNGPPPAPVLSTSMPPVAQPEAQEQPPPAKEESPETPSAPKVEPSYGFSNQVMPGYEHSPAQEAAVNYSWQNQYGQYQAPQFYDPSSYSQVQAPAEGYNQTQPGQDYYQSHQYAQPEQQPPFYDPSMYSQPLQTDSTQPVQYYDQNTNVQSYQQQDFGSVGTQPPPQFYDPSQYFAQPLPQEPVLKEEEIQSTQSPEDQSEQSFPPPPLEQSLEAETQPEEKLATQPVGFFNPNQFAENQVQPPFEEEVRLPSPPVITDEHISQTEEGSEQLTTSLSQWSLQEQRGSPPPSETSTAEPELSTEPINVYNIPQNTSIFSLPTESQTTSPSEPPVSSTPLSSYFGQKVDSRPSSAASNRSQLASFFDRQDTPTTTTHRSAADFFDAPQYFGAPQTQQTPQQVANAYSNAPNQNQFAPQSFSAFSQNQSTAASFFAPQPTEQHQQQIQETPVAPPTNVSQFFATAQAQAPPPATESTKPAVTENAPAVQFFLPPPPQESQVPVQQSVSAPQFFTPPQPQAQPEHPPPPPEAAPEDPKIANPMATFFSPTQNDIFAAPVSTASSAPAFPSPSNVPAFLPPPPASGASSANFFVPQSGGPVEVQEVPTSTPAPDVPKVAWSPTEAPVVQNLPPPAFHSPVRSVPSPPSASSPVMAEDSGPSVQLFNPTLFGQTQKSSRPAQGEGNKFRIKSALNKYALPPSLNNTAPNYFAPQTSTPAAPEPAPAKPAPPSNPVAALLAPFNFFSSSSPAAEPPATVASPPSASSFFSAPSVEPPSAFAPPPSFFSNQAPAPAAQPPMAAAPPPSFFSIQNPEPTAQPVAPTSFFSNQTPAAQPPVAVAPPPSASSFFTAPPAIDPPAAAGPPPKVSSFFSTPSSSQDSSKCKTPPNTPAVMPGMMNPLANLSYKPAESGGIMEISEEAVNKALLASAPAPSTPSEPPSIPVTVSHINPSYPPVINPYSNSAALKQHLQEHQVPFFNPAKSHDAPVTSAENSSSAAPLPPPKAAMSGNNFRLNNSRPQYAQMPGLGSSVSAIASLAASMAMSSPLPSSAAEPRDGFAPIPCIAIGSSQATELGAPSLTTVDPNAAYKPVTHHWFYKRQVETKVIWNPFSRIDNDSLEKALFSDNKDIVVATDGGRYDVHVHDRKRVPIYWDQAPNEVRRCSWFYKNPLDSRFCPYEENFGTKLEAEYMGAYINNRWPRRIELSFGEAIMFSGPNMMSHIPPTSGSILEDWGTIQETGTKSRIVRRGCDDFEIEEGESGKPDHLLFMVHGIGSVCDLKFRTIVEVVDDFRSMTLNLIRSHFKQAGDDGRATRIEVLPVSWHGALHGEETGIDKLLQNITLKSIPRLRHFTNDTLLDILFYTSPVYCQTIIQTVGHEVNRMHQLFLQRNPDFNGGVSLGGHSLGSLIVFDLLCHQKPQEKLPEPEVMFGPEVEVDEDELGRVMPPPTLVRRDSCKVDYMMGHGGTGQPSIRYPQLHFNPMSFFALGSPVGMFVTVRGIESLGVDFSFPTCPALFNIFHPYDPVAFRIEALINPDLGKLSPVLIPHHKGRKRMHIELRETMSRVGTDIKDKLVDSVRSTWNTVYQLAMFNRGETLEQEVDKVLAEQMMATDALAEEYPEGMEIPEPDLITLGKLNGGRRVDYVLQEAPFESFNQYIFALSSHVCYWESEDTILMMVREIYNLLGVSPDRQMDRTRESSAVRDMPRERSWSAGSRSSKGSVSPAHPSFLSPSTAAAAPMTGPPPPTGFVRK